MYDGMAKIKLYADSSCLNELPRAYNGNYVLSTSVVTGNSDINYNRNIYVKKFLYVSIDRKRWRNIEKKIYAGVILTPAGSFLLLFF